MVEQKESQPDISGSLVELIGGATSTAGVVRIDGVAYDAMDPASFTLRESARAKMVTGRIKFLEDQPEPTEADEAEYFQRLGELIHICVPAISDEVLAKLDLAQRRKLAVAFFARVVEMAGPRASRNGTS